MPDSQKRPARVFNAALGPPRKRNTSKGRAPVPSPAAGTRLFFI